MVGQPPDEDLGEGSVLLHGVHGAGRGRPQPASTRGQNPLPPSLEAAAAPSGLQRAHGRALSRQRGRRPPSPPAGAGEYRPRAAPPPL